MNKLNVFLSAKRNLIYSFRNNFSVRNVPHSSLPEIVILSKRKTPFSGSTSKITSILYGEYTYSIQIIARINHQVFLVMAAHSAHEKYVISDILLTLARPTC